jgi:hypothetical protein
MYYTYYDTKIKCLFLTRPRNRLLGVQVVIFPKTRETTGWMRWKAILGGLWGLVVLRLQSTHLQAEGGIWWG